MGSAHAGNIANSGYLVAKLLRRKRGGGARVPLPAGVYFRASGVGDAGFQQELDLFDPPHWKTLRIMGDAITRLLLGHDLWVRQRKNARNLMARCDRDKVFVAALAGTLA